MSEHPRVSVIIPVYNDEAHLGEAVESVMRQTFTNWEVLIVDDDSTDGTPALAASYAARDARVRVLHPGRNVGAPAARDFALRHARGQLIALLDSDDYFLDGYLERSVGLFDEAAAAGRKPGIVASNCYIHNGHQILTQTWADRCPWVDEIDLDRLVEHNYIFARAVADREAVVQVGGVSSECSVKHPMPGSSVGAGEFRYATSDDWDLWMRMLEAGYEVVSTREPLSVYRWVEGGRSRTSWVIADAALRAYRRALERNALNPRQRRVIHKLIRHHRALIAQGRFVEALETGHRREALRLAPNAAVWGAIGFLQAPSRWREWAGEAAGQVSRRAGR